MKRDYDIYLIDNDMSLYQIFDYNNQNYEGKNIHDIEDDNNKIDIEYILLDELDDYPLHPIKSGQDIYIFNIGFLKNAVDIHNKMAEYMEYEY